MRPRGIQDIALGVGAIVTSIAITAPALAAPDPGKKACVKEARILCPAEMKSLSRKKVEACMIRNVEKTSPTCKAAMLKIKAEREAQATATAQGRPASKP